MKPIGTYSPYIKAGNTIYVSGQIPINPDSGQLVQGHIQIAIQQVFENLKTVIQDAGGTLDQIVKLTVYVTNLDYFEDVNEVMQQYFIAPYPARALIEVSRLPKDAPVEMDAVVVLTT